MWFWPGSQTEPDHHPFGGGAALVRSDWDFWSPLVFWFGLGFLGPLVLAWVSFAFGRRFDVSVYVVAYLVVLVLVHVSPYVGL